MHKIGLAFIFAFISFIYQISNTFAVGITPKIRVRIEKNISNIVLSGIDLNRKFLTNNSKQHYSGRKRIKFNCSSIDYKKTSSTVPLKLVEIYSDTGLITYGKEKYKGKIIVTTSDDLKSCDVINEVDIESYISSLLSKEMNGTWHIEALKAQAVAARTYALYKVRQRQFALKRGKKVFYDLESSEKHQVGGDFFDATKKTIDAANETRGQILLSDQGNLTETFFHAACGGYTKTPDQVWSNKVEGYVSTECPYCSHSDKESFVKKISNDRFVEFLRWASKNNYLALSDDLSKFMIAPDRLSNSKLRVYVSGKAYILEKSLFRRYFGRFKFPSNNFVLSQEDDTIIVIGKGHGHGVGMCQLGALFMAQQGMLYNKILKHYYPNHVLKKIFR